MLQANPEPKATVNTFVKDLGLVLAEAKKNNIPLFLSAAAHQMFVQASSWGLGEEDDSSVVRLWEKSGVFVKPT
jgi:putative dehydrogenase